MPYCANCGTEVGFEDKFCPDCGHPNEALPPVANIFGETRRTSPSSPVPTLSASPEPSQGFPSPAAAFPKKKLSGCALAAIIGGAALVLLGALGAMVIFLAFALSSGAVNAMKEHLALLRQGKIERAYQGTSSGFRSVTSLEQYRAFVAAYPALSSVASSTFDERSVENGVTTIGGTITDADDKSIAIRAQMVKEDGEWKVMAVDLPGAGREAASPAEVSGSASWSRPGGAEATVGGIVIGAGRDSEGRLLQPGQALPRGFPVFSADLEIFNCAPGERVQIWVEQGANRSESTDVIVDGAGHAVIPLDLPFPESDFSPGIYSLVVLLGETRTFYKEFEIR